MAEVKEIVLDHPIPGADGKDVSVLKFRLRLRVKDLEHLPSMPEDLPKEDVAKLMVKVQDMMPLVASLTDMPLASVKEIDAVDDLPKVADALRDFIEATSSKTGGSSSGA